MIRKIFVAGLLFALSAQGTWAQDAGDSGVMANVEDEIVNIEIFERATCAHCIDQKEFLSNLSEERNDFTVNYYDLEEEENYELFVELTELEGISKVTPITLIGDSVISGFGEADTTGRVIVDLIDATKGKMQYSFEEFIEAGGSGKIQTVEGGACEDDAEECVVGEEPLYVKIPFYKSVDVSQYSLPALSLVLGLIDGFNPCAMWVLVTFLLILVQIGDRKRMLQVAGLFILAEAIMYYLILNVWLEVWDFVGLDNIVTPLVGLVAIGGGVFFLYEWRTSDGTCKVTNAEKRSKTRSRVHKLAAAEMTIATIIGIIGLALSVNIIEFACSIGIPQAFTKILDINALSTLTKQFYMFLYIVMYMVDDFIVFGIALYAIEKIGVTHKYAKLCNLIGGVLMLILGALLIFAPDALVF